MNETVPVYRMNPVEDKILFGDEIEEGMWVLTESNMARQPHGDDEDSRLRAQRFRRVTRLRRVSGYHPDLPDRVVFVGEWVDGYQEVHAYAVTFGWIWKRNNQPEEAEHV